MTTDNNTAAGSDSSPKAEAVQGHATAFISSLLENGLKHASSNWSEAASYFELLSSLLRLPPPVGPHLCALAAQHNARLSLSAFIIGDAVRNTTSYLGSACNVASLPTRTYIITRLVLLATSTAYYVHRGMH